LTQGLNEIPARLIGDKADDSDGLDGRLLDDWGTEMIAPHRRGLKRKKTQDGRPLRRYRRRWKVERLFAWLQNFRRLTAQKFAASGERAKVFFAWELSAEGLRKFYAKVIPGHFRENRNQAAQRGKPTVRSSSLGKWVRALSPDPPNSSMVDCTVGFGSDGTWRRTQAPR
jgi:hypothetical protein